MLLKGSFIKRRGASRRALRLRKCDHWANGQSRHPQEGRKFPDWDGLSQDFQRADIALRKAGHREQGEGKQDRCDCWSGQETHRPARAAYQKAAIKRARNCQSEQEVPSACKYRNETKCRIIGRNWQLFFLNRSKNSSRSTVTTTRNSREPTKRSIKQKTIWSKKLRRRWLLKPSLIRTKPT